MSERDRTRRRGADRRRIARTDAEHRLKLEDSARVLLAGCDALTLATLDDDGGLATSYVPFACASGSFAVALSTLAAHTVNLRRRPAAAVLALGPPADNAFARARLSVTVVARFAVPGSAASREAWDALLRRHGDVVTTLRALPDFSSVLLEPRNARLIAGFAAAGDLDAAQLSRILAGCARESGPA